MITRLQRKLEDRDNIRAQELQDIQNECEDCGGAMLLFKDGSKKNYCPNCWGDIVPSHD